ncbi:hypothetical protein QJS10_CPB15g00908 [Acorus calamus]|uniref:Uncharacterized protein n=1 Tax=Acorus calamus TaxID=4465 RepID=A0AAV9D720_ACOCL|nr:hypothetical protein QJS10_CPB15g00908 [Acorus calamus]
MLTEALLDHLKSRWKGLPFGQVWKCGRHKFFVLLPTWAARDLILLEKIEGTPVAVIESGEGSGGPSTEQEPCTHPEVEAEVAPSVFQPVSQTEKKIGGSVPYFDELSPGLVAGREVFEEGGALFVLWRLQKVGETDKRVKVERTCHILSKDRWRVSSNHTFAKQGVVRRLLAASGP